MSSIRGGAATEIARRTVEVLDQFERNVEQRRYLPLPTVTYRYLPSQVLDQFERNVEQQAFIMTIFETIDARTRATPEAFDSLPLTVLSDVCQVISM